MKKRRFTKIFALLLAMVMVFALPMEASASKKVTANSNWKKAKAVKTGTTTVSTKTPSKTYYTYVKFTATKTKTYKITISNLRKPGSSSSKDLIAASVHLEKAYYDENLTEVSLTQNKKKTSTLWICSSYSASFNSGKTTSSTYLKSRTASIKLQKGETIYIAFGFSASGSKKCLYDLKIK